MRLQNLHVFTIEQRFDNPRESMRLHVINLWKGNQSLSLYLPPSDTDGKHTSRLGANVIQQMALSSFFFSNTSGHSF
jgi:hypothetical protein